MNRKYGIMTMKNSNKIVEQELEHTLTYKFKGMLHDIAKLNLINKYDLM